MQRQALLMLDASMRERFCAARGQDDAPRGQRRSTAGSGEPRRPPESGVGRAEASSRGLEELCTELQWRFASLYPTLLRASLMRGLYYDAQVRSIPERRDCFLLFKHSTLGPLPRTTATRHRSPAYPASSGALLPAGARSTFHHSKSGGRMTKMPMSLAP